MNMRSGFFKCAKLLKLNFGTIYSHYQLAKYEISRLTIQHKETFLRACDRIFL